MELRQKEKRWSKVQMPKPSPQMGGNYEFVGCRWITWGKAIKAQLKVGVSWRRFIFVPMYLRNESLLKFKFISMYAFQVISIIIFIFKFFILPSKFSLFVYNFLVPLVFQPGEFKLDGSLDIWRRSFTSCAIFKESISNTKNNLSSLFYCFGFSQVAIFSSAPDDSIQPLSKKAQTPDTFDF